MLRLLLLCVFLNSGLVFAQKRDRKRFKINHQPFLVLTASPLNAFDFNNTFMVGAELAPPGKFSLLADYGTGTGNMNIKKIIREQMPDMKTTIMRAELKGYFSDWYFFSNLDRKPLGRYWAVELAQKQVGLTRDAVVGRGLVAPEKYAYYEILKTPIQQKEQVANLKYGTHLLLRRMVIFDVYAGIGLRRYQVSSEKNDEFLYYTIASKYKNWLPNEKGIVPNIAAGFRFCVAL